MGKEGFSNLIIVAVVAILIIGIFGYYLGSKSTESSGDKIIVPEDTAVVPEETSNETQPPATEVAAPNAKEWTVEISNYSFVPQNLTVNVGDKVVWVNKDHFSHKIMSDSAEFVSRPLQTTNDTYSFIFTRAGAYTYRCGVHGDAEKGEIIVS